jgi:2-polyprenyl-3-methyl-5-hydroxy-6-metoxy-1,4-benzoquinol methylase
MYLKEWHGIPFNSFAKLSTTHLADRQFYRKFYKAFFAVYINWEDINSSWREEKSLFAQFLMKLINSEYINIRGGRGRPEILSVGCGIGYIEHILLKSGLIPSQLDILEMDETPLKWIKKELDENNIHIGTIPNCLTVPKKYDLIYMVAVDYALDKNEFITFLKNLGERMSPNGKLVVFTASFNFELIGYGKKILMIKNTIKFILHFLKIVTLGQFWGYYRTRSEFQSSMKYAGLTNIEDGFIDDPEKKKYWISGCKK